MSRFFSKDEEPTKPIAPPKHDHLATCEAAIVSVTKKICDEMYVDTIEEARRLMDKHRMDHHVLELRDERAELEFLNMRRGQLLQKLADEKAAAAAEKVAS